jgi:hypothetical protein
MGRRLGARYLARVVIADALRPDGAEPTLGTVIDGFLACSRLA